MRRGRKLLLVVVLTAIGAIIGMVFWYQELQYKLATPLPDNYQEVPVGSQLQVSFLAKDGKPKLLHFYNPSCPCSRFNAEHVKELYYQYGKEVTFYIVVEKGYQKARDEFDMPIIEDPNGILADRCGVYATPQAVVLDGANNLYYRGNYNKERYCTAKNTNFAELAINRLLKGEQKSEFSQLATRSYGCQLTSDKKN